MLVEQRTYTVKAGASSEFLAQYAALGFDVQRSVLGRPFGFFSTDIGPLNQIVQMWAYESLAERAERRARLASIPEWKAWVAQALPFHVHQENRILVPASFAPVTRVD